MSYLKWDKCAILSLESAVSRGNLCSKPLSGIKTNKYDYSTTMKVHRNKADK